MQLLKSAIVVALFSVFPATSTPVEAIGQAPAVLSTVVKYSGDNCDGNSETWQYAKQDSGGCQPVTNARSIRVDGK